jgi:hypothetical protein
MASIVSPNVTAARLKGRVAVYYSTYFQKWIVRSVATHMPPPTAKQKAARADFTLVADLIKKASGLDVKSAYAQTKHVHFRPHDYLAMAAFGTLNAGRTTDGQLWIGGRVAQKDIETLLDSISNVPGSVLVRTTDAWEALLPGVSAEVLTIDGLTGQPAWLPSSGGGGGASSFITTCRPIDGNNYSGNYIDYAPLWLPAGFTVSTVGAFASADQAATHWVIGLYRMSGGSPTALLSQSAVQTGLVADTLVEAPLAAPYTAATAAPYALAFWRDNTASLYRDASASRYNQAHASSDLPDPAVPAYVNGTMISMFARDTTV